MEGDGLMMTGCSVRKAGDDDVYEEGGVFGR